MTKEEIYLAHKKEHIIKQVQLYNETGINVPFQIDEEHFDLEETFCTPQECKGCGKCCERFPCAFAPYDFLDINDLKYMRKILNTGLVVISSTYNGVRIIRSRGIADKKEIVTIIAKENPCLFRGEKGCLLPANYRPTDGLLYYKSFVGHKKMYTAEDEEYEYEPYQDSLNTLYFEYINKQIPLELDTYEKDDETFSCFKEKDVQQLTKRLAGY